MEARTIPQPGATAEAPFDPSTYAVDSNYQRRILAGINATGKHVYAGTVAPATIAKRRAANKAARQARKLARA